MATVSANDTAVESSVQRLDTRGPAVFVGILLARSFGLAAGVALIVLLAAAIFSTL
jgi:hypothetical protein